MTERSDILVSTEWLAAHLGDGNVVVIDGSWHMPAAQRDAAAEFEASHIPGAVFFDIDKVADTSSGLPHMLPSAEFFAATAGALGIAETDTIVVYDSVGLFSAARVRWTFRTMGARDVRILDGGLPAWKAGGRPLETGKAAPKPKTFHATLDAEAVKSFDQVKAISSNGSAQIVDARAGDRFRAEVPEPRAGLASGHIPGSRNLPFNELVADGKMKSAEDIRAAYEAAGVDLSKPIVTSCGSGVTASVLALGLNLAGVDKVAIYDGSWTEWGGRADAPVETGPAK